MNHNSKVSASKVVNNNRNLYPELVTNIVSQQEKERLYKSLHAKLARSVNMSKIKGKYLKSNANSRGKQQFYYIATASKVDRYNRKRSKLFKKKPEPAKKPWYIRKKMKRFPAELPELTRSQKRKVAKRIIPSTGIKHKTEMNFLSFRLLLKSRKFAYARKLFYYYFLKYVLSMFNVRVFAFKESNVPSKQIIHDIVDSNLLKDIEKDIKKKRKGKRNKKSKFAYNIDKKSTRLYEAPLSLTPQGTRVKIYFHILEKNQTLIEKMIKDKTNKDISDYLKFNKPIVVNVDLLKTVANNSLAINKSNDLDYVLSNVNFVVSQFLDKVLAKSGITEKERKLKVMFKKFSKGHYSRYLSKL
jgi:adenosyl cobinamide kinase/adenosyl cobinamide phosphate guanylyltransferase